MFDFWKDKEPKQAYHDGSGNLQCFLHAAVAVCSICLTYPGKCLRK